MFNYEGGHKTIVFKGSIKVKSHIVTHLKASPVASGKPPPSTESLE